MSSLDSGSSEGRDAHETVDAVNDQKKILQVLEEAYRARAGADGLDELMDRFLPFEASEWIFRALEAAGTRGGRKGAKKREDSPATVAEEIAATAAPLVHAPAVVLGSRLGLMAGMLGAALGVEPVAARVALARKAWPETRFVEMSPFDWTPDAAYRFFLLDRLCGQLPREKGFMAYRDLLGRIVSSSGKGAHAVMVDDLRYQDDLVEILARSDCEIVDLSGLVDRKTVVIVAGLRED